MTTNTERTLDLPQFIRAVGIAGRIIQARDSLLTICGAERYPEKVAPWRKVIRETVKNAKCSTIQAPLVLAQRSRESGESLDGLTMAWLLAACADEVDGEARGGGDGQAVGL